MEKKRNYYTSLTRKLLIAFFCLSALPIISFAWLMKDTVEETNLVKLEQLVNSTINHRTEVISLFLADKLELLSMLVAIYPRSFFFTQQNVEQLFPAIAGQGDIVDLQVIDAEGRQHSYVGPYRAMIEGKTYAESLWFKETMISGVHVSNVFTGYRNVPHFVVAVTDSLRSFVLRATINSSMFNSLLHSAQLGVHGDAFIINRNGEFQTPSLQEHSSISETERMLIGHDTSASAYITPTDIYAGRWIEQGNWLLIVRANIGDSLGYYHKLRNRIIGIVLAIVVLSMIAATFTALTLSARLEQADREHAAHSLQFAHMEKMATVGRLAAGIAHEINNPLQLITSQAGWVAELLPDEDPTLVKNLDEYRQAMDQIRYHVKRAGTITHRLLSFSRKMSSQNEQVQLNDLLEETLSFIDKEAQDKQINISRNFAADLPVTMTDGPQLQQVFLNLINNSMDAAGQGGRIELSTSHHRSDQGTVLQMQCGDNGPGIRPEHLQQIFDPFFTTKGPDKGTGLGLYISYDIVKKLGGTISAENRPSGGALFTIRLPLVSLGRPG